MANLLAFTAFAWVFGYSNLGGPEYPRRMLPRSLLSLRIQSLVVLAAVAPARPCFYLVPFSRLSTASSSLLARVRLYRLIVT